MTNKMAVILVFFCKLCIAFLINDFFQRLELYTDYIVVHTSSSWGKPQTKQLSTNLIYRPNLTITKASEYPTKTVKDVAFKTLKSIIHLLSQHIQTQIDNSATQTYIAIVIRIISYRVRNCRKAKQQQLLHYHNKPVLSITQLSGP